MNEDDQSTAPRGAGDPGGDKPRRGPVIRTSDFVTTVSKAPSTPAPDADDELRATRARIEREMARAQAGRRDDRPSPATEPLSERLARLAPDAAHNRLEPPDDRPEQPRREPNPTHPIPVPVRPDAVEAGQGPLLDAAMVVQATWHNRRVAAALILGLAILGGAASPFVPRKYTASTTLYFDPQRIRLDDTQGGSIISQEAVLAIIDSQAQILSSRRVLSATAKTLGLATDPEFGGQPAQTTAKLAKAIDVAREASTYVVDLTVKSKNPERAAEIANTIVATFLKEQQQTSDGIYSTANATLDGRLSDLGEQLRQAEQAVADYKAQHAIDAANAAEEARQPSLTPSRTDQLQTLLIAAQGKTIAAKAKYDAASKFQIGDLASGNLPAEGATSALLQLQQQYSAAAATVSSLETRLGARHPQLQAARASMTGLSSALQREVTRMITAAQAEYERAQKEEDGIARQLAAERAADNNQANQLIEYRELQRKADSIREIYQTVLKRTRQTGEEQRLDQSNIRVISPAEAPIQADGPSRAVLTVGCVLGGLVLGLMLAIVYSVTRLFMSRQRS